MTFSLVARCADTGQFGAAVATAGLCVGARVPFAMAGVGAVVTQHWTDPRLGPRGLALLRSGCTAQETVDALVASTPDHRWRQLAVIDRDGATAHFHGGAVMPGYSQAHGNDVVALGNRLTNRDVPAAMADAFEEADGKALAERLILALEAGAVAAGETIYLWSAALLVVEREAFPLVDLRVDRMRHAVTGLRLIWEEYGPVADQYVMRAINPADSEAAVVEAGD